MNSKLTVNIGVRYEFANPPYDTTDRLGNLWIRRDPQSGNYSGTLMWATTNPEVDPETGQRNQPAKQLGFGRCGMAIRCRGVHGKPRPARAGCDE